MAVDNWCMHYARDLFQEIVPNFQFFRLFSNYWSAFLQFIGDYSIFRPAHFSHQWMSPISIPSIFFWSVLVHVVVALLHSSSSDATASKEVLKNVLRGLDCIVCWSVAVQHTTNQTISPSPKWRTLQSTAYSRGISSVSTAVICPEICRLSCLDSQVVCLACIRFVALRI